MKEKLGGLLLILLLFPFASQANEQSFPAWLKDFRAEAQQKGLRPDVLDGAFRGIVPADEIITLDRKQPENTVTFSDYLTRVVSEDRIEMGRENADSYRPELERVSKAYGVPVEIIVALWGVETSYGLNIGDYSVVEALTTLAYDGRRSDFFRKELMQALFILQDEGITPEAMFGSWAGAMGQCQFMPSSYREYAVDFNHDGRKDIWNTEVDVFASTANYLKERGWDDSIGWGYRVRMPDDMHLPADVSKRLSEWRAMGVKQIDGHDLPDSNATATLLFPDNNRSIPVLATTNFDVLRQWNRSTYFATSVGMLANAIAE